MSDTATMTSRQTTAINTMGAHTLEGLEAIRDEHSRYQKLEDTNSRDELLHHAFWNIADFEVDHWTDLQYADNEFDFYADASPELDGTLGWQYTVQLLMPPDLHPFDNKDHLRSTRILHDETLEEIALVCGVQRSAISRWEHGHRAVTAHHQKTLSAHYIRLWKRQMVFHYLRDTDRHFTQTTGIQNRASSHRERFETFLADLDFTDLPAIGPARGRVPHPPWEDSFDQGFAPSDERFWTPHLIKLHRS